MKQFNNQFATQKLRGKEKDEEPEDSEEVKSDYMKNREDPEYYLKQYKKHGKSDYIRRRRKELEEEGNMTGGEAYLPGLDVPEKKYKGPEESKERGTGKGFIFKDLWEELNENYSRFKKETKTKTNEQQFHAAVRLAEKKISEANRILEYTSQLKTELSVIKENKNTQKLMERITRGIAEAYGKMKKLKL